MEQSTVTTRSTKLGVSGQQGQNLFGPAHIPACLIVFNELPGVRHPKDSLTLDE